MAHELTPFEQNHIELLKNFAEVTKQEKELKRQIDEFKETLLPLMEQAGVVNIKNDFITISYIAESESVALDTKAIKLDDPFLYHDLMDKYNKRTHRKASLRVSAK